MTPPRPLLAALVFALAFPAACKKVIGDSCSVNSDCSISGDRVCDLSQSGGYCTVPACEPDSCPDNGVCVYFDAHTPRLRRRYCMAGCRGDDDCNSGYRCQPSDPPACLASAPAVPGPGDSCNVIADTRNEGSYSGWCVQAR